MWIADTTRQKGVNLTKYDTVEIWYDNMITLRFEKVPFTSGRFSRIIHYLRNTFLLAKGLHGPPWRGNSSDSAPFPSAPATSGE